MASKSSKREQIWISPRAKSILDSRKGSARKQIDKLLGINTESDVEKTPLKIYDKPQNNLIDLLICNSIREYGGSLRKVDIYSGVLLMSRILASGSLSWAMIYKDFFNQKTAFERKSPLMVTVDNRLNKASSLYKSGIISRELIKNKFTGLNESFYSLNPDYNIRVSQWLRNIRIIRPSNHVEIPGIASAPIVIEGVDTAPIDNWTIEEVFNSAQTTYLQDIRKYYKEAVEKGEDIFEYTKKKREEEREANTSDKGQYKLWFGEDSNE